MKEIIRLGWILWKRSLRFINETNGMNTEILTNDTKVYTIDQNVLRTRHT